MKRLHKSPPAFASSRFLGDGHSDGAEAEAQHSFDLHCDVYRGLMHLMHLLTTCASFENSLFSSFSHSLIEVFVLLALITSTSCLLENETHTQKMQGQCLRYFSIAGTKATFRRKCLIGGSRVQSIGTHHHDGGEYGGRNRQMGITLEQQLRILGLHGL